MTRRVMLIVAAAAVAVAACASDAAVDCPRCPDPVTTPPPEATKPKPAKPPRDAAARQTDRRQTLAFVGFTKDGAKFMVEANDEFMGDVLQVWDASAGRIVDSLVTTSFTRASALKKLLKKHAVVELTEGSAKRPDGDLALLGADDGDWLVIYAQEGERAVPVLRLPRLVDKDRRADASVARILWAPSGDYAVVLSRQVLPAPFAFASDYVDIWRYDPDELPF
ncbi:MAG: hypothetical protein KC635_25355 [Myxococcales bacterium]|nr:hypothetical protein [Myxococcales bacterium]MCB9737530.1 hypothetical protein [Deltaproteobacteria bacterium]